MFRPSRPKYLPKLTQGNNKKVHKNQPAYLKGENKLFSDARLGLGYYYGNLAEVIALTTIMSPGV